MSATPSSLVLTTEQKSDLTNRLKIDLTKIFFVENTLLQPAAALDGYSTGHYLFFVGGTQSQHVEFYKIMYGTNTIPELVLKVPGIWVYETPSAKFATTENQVTVS